MPKAQFLVRNRHNSKYFFRGIVPIDLRPHFGGRREFRVALDTSNKQIAKRKAMAYWLELQAVYDQVRKCILSDEDTIKRLRSHAMIAKVKESLANAEIRTLRQELGWAKAGELIEKKRANQMATQTVVALAGGNTKSPVPDITPKPFNQVATEYIEKYSRQGGRGKPPAPTTLSKRREKAKFWAGLYGDQPIHEIGKAEIGKAQDFIYNLPKNSSKWYDSPADAVEAAINGHERKVISSGKTAVDYLRVLGDIFKHADQRGYIEQNPAVHLHEVKQHKEDEALKPPFSEGDLIKIFPADYGAHFQRQGTPDPTRMMARFWVPLLALLGGARVEELCQLRVDDIGLCDDTGTPYYRITDEGEAHDGKAKSLKNKNSIRLVPIHPHLIDVGFLDFVEDRRNEGGDTAGLFALQRGEGQRMGKQISSWFSRLERRERNNGEVSYVGGYIENRGVETKGEIGGKSWSKSLHTFRHTLINHLRTQKHPTTREEFTEAQIDQLTGHAKSQSSVNTYTQDGLKVMKLRAAAITAANAVDFDFLPFDEIRWDKFKSEYL